MVVSVLYTVTDQNGIPSVTRSVFPVVWLRRPGEGTFVMVLSQMTPVINGRTSIVTCHLPPDQHRICEITSKSIYPRQLLYERLHE